jgi:hypothetical protein
MALCGMSDDPRQTAFDQAAPASERFDANAELGRIYRPTGSGLIPSSEMQQIISFIDQGLEDSALLKARGSANILTFPDARGGSWGTTQGKPTNKPGPGMRSLYVDDLQVFASGEYFEKPSPVGFDALRVMCEQTPILASVLQTRVRQVNRFCQISEDGGPGFEIRHVDRTHILTSEEQTSTQLIAKFMANCGWEFNARQRKRLRRDPFAHFMAKSMRDSLAMDACPIETEWKRDRSLGLDGFYAVDGATIRLCMEDGYQGDDEIFALQVVNGRIVTAYTMDQLVYEVRNPRTDVRLSGYGLGEPELMIRIVTGFLNALTYNIRGFDENSIPKGLLHMSGDYSQEDISAFRRYWNSMVKGINNAWALPVMISKDTESKATFESFGVEFNEMYFAKWMSFLASIVCAIYGMDPAEINFESFSADKSSLSGSDTGEKLAAAKDKGLRPFMSFYEQTLTDFIVGEFSEKYCFRWVGLEDENDEQVWEARKLILSTNELRAEMGYEPYPVDEGGLDFGTAPLNPALVPVWQIDVQGPPPGQPGDEFGGDKPGEQEDFGTVDGEGDPADAQPGTQAAGGMPPDQPEDDAFGQKKGPTMAKAYVYAIPGFVREDRP